MPRTIVSFLHAVCGTDFDLSHDMLLFWLALCVGGGAVVGVLTGGGETAWYVSLRKPAWNPPAWVFGPVWTTLYALMAVAAWRVWRKGGWSVQGQALTMFLIQLALNWAWSFVFFTLQSPGVALVELLFLWLAVLTTMRMFLAIDSIAGRLLMPYLAWVTFAAALNGAIVFLN